MQIDLIEHIFSIQGEPGSMGKPAYFIRFPGCNLNCTFCDTNYASKKKTGTLINIEDLKKEIISSGTKLIVITGGEPLMKKESILKLDEALPKCYTFEIETNGTMSPLKLDRKVRYNVSPKLECSGNLKENRYKPDILTSFLEEEAIFKFVVQTDEDFDEVNSIVEDILIPKSKVWIMPEGITDEQVKEHALQFVERIKKENYNLTLRLHIWLYGNKKNV